MKTKSTTTELVIIALLLSPVVYLSIIWNQVPATIATHFDLQGKPNGWMSKEMAALVMGGLSVFLYALLRFLPSFDPKEKLQTSNYQKLRVVVTLVIAGVMIWLFYGATHSANGNASMAILLALVSLLLAGMGNYMTTVKPNYFIGIKTPWTLQNDEVWRKTHRVGGRMMVVGGLLSAVLALVVPMPYTVWVVTAILLTVSLVPIVYSYISFRQEKAHQLN